LVSFEIQIFVNDDLICGIPIFLRSEFKVKILSILEALTFWIILFSVGRLKERELVKIILFVFFANKSNFFVWIVKRWESLVWIFLWICTIWKRYSSAGWSMRLNKEVICDKVSFLYLIREKKFSILLKIVSKVGLEILFLS